MKKYFAVIDTNVVVSALLKEKSVPGDIIMFVKNDVIVPVIGEAMLLEYSKVLKENGFGFSKQQQQEMINLFRMKGIFLEESTSNDGINEVHSKDLIIYKIVLSGRENNDTYLVTGNVRHFPKRSFVVTPREMLEIIELTSKL